MGLFSALKNLVGSPGARLASPDPHAVEVELDRLAVHTADGLIIVETSPSGAKVLAEVARAGEAAQLRGPRTGAQTTVYLSPTTAQERPVHDPQKGWVIPLSPEELALLENLSTEPGDYEISTALAIAIEGV
ncbi:hypothetical protein [Corynebacterium minutissimum]|uniref:Uncharacterized protein n=1 Tax=Corynebacterium minutissimum TaxID=38301 RepID=A0A2X4RT07_9CORY|nr:hypothetical protein [Corynebacterium minutissimum]KHO29769.1 hypothetical protein NX84_05360 [Corynebacterium minutissimum]QPS60752.1 hypothetical protein I6G51_06175 [Corynebacterium minutissimum]QQA78461.1 hypothetical protein I6H49_06680 [Corynebacterium minutissimum]SQI00352.1 Uncharacterised protein [Corynebacterium minutissimum]VEG05581.1 Uncharacterised protein [Corynebacterium minutissimum]